MILSPILNPSFPRKFSRAQLYTINEIRKKNSENVTAAYISPTLIDVLAKIPVKVGALNPYNNVFEQVIEFTNGVNIFTNKRIYTGPVDIKRLRISLIDDKGHIMNLNHADWSLSLTAEQLYQF